MFLMLSVFCAVPVSLLLKYIKLYLLLVFIINLTDTSLISSNLTKLLRHRRRKVGCEKNQRTIRRTLHY
ncbi:rCG20294, isoform CRA_b [Rattus norvegicus]|uniref:RCG20294, isoform CRA_b n=1 Tax=Rattus norvegicus TaxID=10116 RepID=A6JGH7_RAT|nr:rCG20294, isoform CRA_b [Rattus norvegicus]